MTLTTSERLLRSNIRNAYIGATVAELKKELSYRIRLGRTSFELECFNQLIREALKERDGK